MIRYRAGLTAGKICPFNQDGKDGFLNHNMKSITMNNFIDNLATVGSGILSFIVIWVQGIIQVNEFFQVFIYAAIAAAGGLSVKFLVRLITWLVRRIFFHDKSKIFRYKI
jgi:hypothetical protein